MKGWNMRKRRSDGHALHHRRQPLQPFRLLIVDGRELVVPGAT